MVIVFIIKKTYLYHADDDIGQHGDRISQNIEQCERNKCLVGRQLISSQNIDGKCCKGNLGCERKKKQQYST